MSASKTLGCASRKRSRDQKMTSQRVDPIRCQIESHDSHFCRVKTRKEHRQSRLLKPEAVIEKKMNKGELKKKQEGEMAAKVKSEPKSNVGQLQREDTVTLYTRVKVDPSVYRHHIDDFTYRPNSIQPPKFPDFIPLEVKELSHVIDLR